ncbi:hypothetical protein BT63DRAFT_460558 [Microthyrium microscopicum]|uniref:Uncharacterized protein n=1 Tax=Microthyrium microscopicum TaxID=703497 RepID=A0A6A6TZ22_9PEZI|nr:hypothetical protein BT63DRAFT_460558 [Microthyrium microscopicum]
MSDSSNTKPTSKSQTKASDELVESDQPLQLMAHVTNLLDSEAQQLKHLEKNITDIRKTISNPSELNETERSDFLKYFEEFSDRFRGFEGQFEAQHIAFKRIQVEMAQLTMSFGLLRMFVERLRK